MQMLKSLKKIKYNLMDLKNLSIKARQALILALYELFLFIIKVRMHFNLMIQLPGL